MKQAPNSLLTCRIPFKAPDVLAFPRDMAGALGLRLTPFTPFVHQGRAVGFLLLAWSCFLRSTVRTRLGEGRIRSLLQAVCMSIIVAVASSPDGIGADGVNQPPRMETKGAAEPPDLGAVAVLLKERIAEGVHWKASEIEVRVSGNAAGSEFPAGVSFRLAGEIAKGRKSVMALVEAVQGGKTQRSFWITADVKVTAQVATAVRRIPRGRTVVAEDLAESVVQIPDFRVAYVRNPEEIIGRTSDRAFSTGDPLVRDYFVSPYLVRSGETVELRLERDGIVLRSRARAEQDGSLGQFIRVRNIDFDAALKAQVTGRAEVRLP